MPSTEETSLIDKKKSKSCRTQCISTTGKILSAAAGGGTMGVTIMAVKDASPILAGTCAKLAVSTAAGCAVGCLGIGFTLFFVSQIEKQEAEEAQKNVNRSPQTLKMVQ